MTRSPACFHSIGLGAKPTFSLGGVDNDLAIVPRARKVINPLAMAVHIALDFAAGRTGWLA